MYTVGFILILLILHTIEIVSPPMENWWYYFGLPFYEHQKTHLKIPNGVYNHNMPHLTLTFPTFNTVVDNLVTNQQDKSLFPKSHGIVRKYEVYLNYGNENSYIYKFYAISTKVHMLCCKYNIFQLKRSMVSIFTNIFWRIFSFYLATCWR